MEKVRNAFKRISKDSSQRESCDSDIEDVANVKSVKTEPKAPANMVQVSATTTAALMKKLYSGDGIFLSPASISVALAMAYEGASGKTRKQMSEVLFAGMEDVAGEHGQLLRALNPDGQPYEMRAANRLYLHNEMEVEAPFLESMNKNFEAGFQLVDFKKKYKEVPAEVNSWVSTFTNGRIQNLIADGVLDEDTRFILVNAIYFKGKWKYQFKEERTKVDTFHVSRLKNEQKPMMNLTGQFGLARNDSYKMLRMRYTGEQVSMLILLPNDRHGLRKVISNLTGETISEAIEKTDYVCFARNVIVKLPRFKLEAQFELSQPLKDLKCGEMFEHKPGNFTGITKDQDLCISAVIHKAFVEVNEEGTEAAAATAVIGMECCSGGGSPPPPEYFIADHPFLFFIIQEPGIVLFGGAITNPQE